MSALHETEKEKVTTEVLRACYFSPCVMYAVELDFFLNIKELQRQFK